MLRKLRETTAKKAGPRLRDRARCKTRDGVRLHPGKSLIEIVVRAYNRTPDVQTFLWWTNAAMRVHEQYQSFFPTDVTHVADHAKRCWPSWQKAS